MVTKNPMKRLLKKNKRPKTSLSKLKRKRVIKSEKWIDPHNLTAQPLAYPKEEIPREICNLNRGLDWFKEELEEEEEDDDDELS